MGNSVDGDGQRPAVRPRSLTTGNTIDANAFLSAVEEGDKKSVYLCIRHYPEKWKTARNRRGESCLHLARDAEIADLLFLAGADIEALDGERMTPFHKAVQKGNREMMEALIANGCNIHAKGAFGEALAYASHLEIIKRLIELGMDVNHKSNWRGNTSLLWACWDNQVEIAEYLLSVGADIEAVNDGRTPFLQAIYFGHERVMNLLIVNGSNIYAKDNENRGAIEIADSENRLTLKEKVVKIFSEREAAFSTNKAVTADEKEEIISQREVNAEETTSTEDSEPYRSSPTLHLYQTEEPEDASRLEEETIDVSQQLVCELQSRLDKSEKERNAACAEKERLVQDLRASQQLVREFQRRLEEERDSARTSEQLQHRLDTERASARAKERHLTENLHSFQQLVRDLQKEKDAILLEHKNEMEQVQKAIQYLRDRCAQAETDLNERCAQLEEERDEARLVAQEAQRNLSKYESVPLISSADVDVQDVKLGGGSHGDVRVGRWRGCNVAVKTFYDFLRVDVYIRRLEQEISICSQVRHPNVVSLLGVITQDDIPLRIISELLEASLSDIIVAADRRLFLREQVDVAVGCSSGICYLHGLDILHGDIRSTNVVVTSVMEAKVCDLGAARFAEVSSLSAGPMSPDYVAPERLKPGQHNTKMADIYSLGVTFIELMTGEQPATTKRMAQGTSVRHRIIKRLCLQMVGVNRLKRPSAGECLARLEDIQKSDEEYKRCPAKRMVKGKMHGGEKVELLAERWN
ncbi:serine/threonine-protein kinase TNNI3K-like isoform X2 [Oscarella lobularis]|uniref:serine/threonine-protein kinase TNNI3K-like isoform X2 n=1 Tax=Oscarella lobularis TaxID=121494 RepID=UPI0033133D89